MFNLLRKSLSRDKSDNQSVADMDSVEKVADDPNSTSTAEPTPTKRHRSDDLSPDGHKTKNSKRKKRLSHEQHIEEDTELSRSTPTPTSVCGIDAKIKALPADTPAWGIALLEIVKGELRSVNSALSEVETTSSSNTADIKVMQSELVKSNERCKVLQDENSQLKEKLLDLEYQQRRNNLIFEGISDAEKEKDLDCIRKIRFVLKDIPGLDVNNFRIDRCHRIDGPFKAGINRRVICAFNWYYDVQCVLRSRKSLPRGVYVSEDLPEEWVDRRRILKPVFNAAKRKDDLKDDTHLSKDRLVISGKTYTVENITEAGAVLNLSSTCENSDEKTILFQGLFSPFSNFYQSKFTINNVTYNSAEQFIQSEKAAFFNDDTSTSRIMRESNPYKIKKLGSKVKRFHAGKWKDVVNQVVFRAVFAKFSQNNTLRQLLLSTAEKVIAEGTTDEYWGIGMHLHD